MQTFLPFDDFEASARVLDSRRLGKQRVETLQVLQVLLGHKLVSWVKDEKGKKVHLPKEKWTLKPVASKGWTNHPAVAMWRGSEGVLVKYQEAVCNEWTSRGYRDTCLEKTQYLYGNLGEDKGNVYPWWMGREDVHRGHQSNLLRKAHEMTPEKAILLHMEHDHYDLAFPAVPDNLPYVWPSTTLS